MIGRLAVALAVIVAGVAMVAHADPGASWLAVGGWGLLLAGWAYVVTIPQPDELDDQ